MTEAMPIDGYLKGHYYIQVIDNTKSSVVFVDALMEKHLDLFEIDHLEDEWVSDIDLSSDFRTITYTLSSKEGMKTFVHHLDRNETQTLGGDLSNTVIIFDDHQYLEIPKQIETSDVSFELVAKESLMALKSDSVSSDSTSHSIVLSNGIVMDPDTNTMKFGYDIGIVDNKIVTISDAKLTGEQVIDVTGLIVSPGFIDMLGFNLSDTVAKYKIADGVTTNLSMHGCTEDFEGFFR